jgi:hypothetical protein
MCVYDICIINMYVYVILHTYFIRNIGYMALNWILIVEDELGGKKKHAVVTYFRVLSQHLTRGTEGNHVKMAGLNIGIQNRDCHHDWLPLSWEFNTKHCPVWNGFNCTTVMFSRTESYPQRRVGWVGCDELTAATFIAYLLGWCINSCGLLTLPNYLFFT